MVDFHVMKKKNNNKRKRKRKKEKDMAVGEEGRGGGGCRWLVLNTNFARQLVENVEKGRR